MRLGNKHKQLCNGLLIVLCSWILASCKTSNFKPYTEDYRPQFHYTPKANWMNDPNGTIYHNGVYHLYYQHNPQGKEWGHMQWGHASSSDLLHWQEHPIAIAEEENTWIFSGSVVSPSKQNSGNELVAFYTGVHRDKEYKQQVDMAYSNDGGMSYQKPENNTVLQIDSASLPEEFNAAFDKFGDPQVFWYSKEEKWVMVNIFRKDTGRIQLYESYDLKKWNYLSEYSHPDIIGMYECPMLRKVPVIKHPETEKWILKWDMPHPHRSYYLIGNFDGKQFIPDQDATVQCLDKGNFYASIAWNGIPNDDVIITGWITEEPRENKVWTGVQSLPRKLFLKYINDSYQLFQTPYFDVSALQKKKFLYQDMNLTTVNSLIKKQKCKGKALEIKTQISPNNSTEFGINVLQRISDSISIHYNTKTEELSILGGFKEYKTHCPLEYDALILQIFVDHSVIEIFANDGKVALSGSCYPTPANENISIYANGKPSINEFIVTKLKTTWN